MDLSLKVPECGVSKTNEELPSTAVVQIPWEMGDTGQCETWGILKVAALGKNNIEFYIRLMPAGTCWFWLEKRDLGKCISKILARATWNWLMEACRTLP